MPDFSRRHREAWDRSARDYAAFASHSGLYLHTAAALVRRARIRRGMTLVDLACGSGMVTEAVLRQPVGNAVTVIATDFSSQMIAVAGARIVAPNVRFHCEAAERLSRVATDVDRILCNAAFWQFDREAALAEMVRVLKPSGRCLFTLPDWAGLIDEADALYGRHKLLWMILEEMFLRGYRVKRAPRWRAAPTASGQGGDGLRLSAPGLEVESVEPFTVDATADDYLEFLRIPVMMQRFADSTGVSAVELREILRVVRYQLDWSEVITPPQQWRVVTLRRTAG